MTARPRIALIHATPLAIEPIQAAFAAGWPEAELANILDDSLSRDRARDGDLTPAMFERFRTLADYAVSYGADGILFTCSAFGEAIEAAAEMHPIPILKPNEAMFDAALAMGMRIGMVATFGPSIPSMEAEFAHVVAGRDPRPTLQSVLAEGAMEALRDGDGAEHDRRVADAAARLENVDAVMLAQFSTARAVDAVRSRVRVPVLTSPATAVARLRERLGA
jgi:Asp/Glu/hydantoin racemase